MKKRDSRTILILMAAVTCLFAAGITLNAVATITDGYPGYPNQWEGMTTNTTIEINLDTPVALIGGDPTAPDVDICVKKATFSGLDFVFTDVPCEVEVSADRKTLKLYPTDLLDANEIYSYKVNDINFEGGGSQQEVAGYFETGDNPVPILATQVDEIDLCSDEGGNLLTNKINFWCLTCHIYWQEQYPASYGVCTITP